MTRRPWLTSNPVVIKKKIRSLPQVEAEIRREMKAAKPVAPSHPYEAIRSSGPLGFATQVLRMEGLLEEKKGCVFVDGKYATPAVMIDRANAVLSRLGLKPIVLGRRR